MRKKKFTKMTALLLVTALSAATVFSGCNKKVDYDVDGDGNSENRYTPAAESVHIP